MYGICSYIWMTFGVNVGTYSIHGAYGYEIMHHVKNMIVDMGTNRNLEDVEARIRSTKLDLNDSLHLDIANNHWRNEPSTYNLDVLAVPMI